MNNVNIKNLKKRVESLKVLFVDDEEEIRLSSKKLLLKFFNNVKTARDGEEAIKLVNKNKFDIVISDIIMPNLNGIDLAEEIKKTQPDVFFIFISASREAKEECEIRGKLFEKPLSFENVILIMQNADKKFNQG